MLVNPLIFPELEQALFDYKKLMYQPELVKQLKKRLIQNTFKYHLEYNTKYKEYAASFDLNFQDATQSFFDYSVIPLLPSFFFKGFEYNLLTVPKENILKYCTSSGTQGSLSLVPRDETTLMYFLSSIASSFPALLDLDRTGNHKGIVLGPSTQEAGDIWFSYAIACLTLQVTTEACEKNGHFDRVSTVNKIKHALSENNDVLVVGPPFRILEICEIIKQIPNFPALTPKSYIISAGGWKNRQNEAIHKNEFIHTVADSFRLDGTSQIRDCFNMVELNTVILECEHHVKHVPPWLEVQARHPKLNEILPSGETGVLAFLDASAVSYPCFILSEDFGAVSEIKCACGREGQVVNISRRMDRIEARGCALKMAIGANYKAHGDSSDRFFESFYRNPSLYLRNSQ